MMKKVSGTNSDLQKFVVNMVGCVTIEEPMLLVLEFVTHSDLLSYLRSIRKKVKCIAVGCASITILDFLLYYTYAAFLLPVNT